MILEIYVVMLDKSFDFKVNEKIPVGEMKKQILQELSMGGAGIFDGEQEDWSLVDVERECIPAENRTVEENHIRGGSRLLLF